MVNDHETGTSIEREIAAFRGFNRMYTRFLGALNEGLLDSEFSLAEARVLYELANRETPRAGEIASDLGIDPGYLSRLLGKFERDGLLKRRVDAEDGRSIELQLTARGRNAFKRLNELSNRQAQQVLEALTPQARMELMASMHTIEHIIMPAETAKKAFVLRPHRVGDMGWIVHREGVGYAEQYGWNESFEGLVAKIVSEFLENFDPKRERCWVAEMNGQSVGHIFLVKHPERKDTAKLRLLFVEPSARGLGLGDALVSECVRFARSAGYKTVVLWTQSILTAAHKLYERAGFRLMKETLHHSFGHDLVGQEWELELE